MKLRVTNPMGGYDPMEALVGELSVKGIALIVMQSFEDEIDDLLSVDKADPNPALREALLRRYTVVEDMFNDLQATMNRLDVKMGILGAHMVTNWTDRGTT